MLLVMLLGCPLSEDTSGSTQSEDAFGCPRNTPPVPVFESEMYEGSVVRDQDGRISGYYMNANPLDEEAGGTGANGTVYVREADPAEIGENVRCLAGLTFSWLGGEGDSWDDGQIWGGTAVIDLTRTSGGAGCGTARYEEVTFGSEAIGKAYTFSGDPDVECQVEGTPD